METRRRSGELQREGGKMTELWWFIGGTLFGIAIAAAAIFWDEENRKVRKEEAL